MYFLEQKAWLGEGGLYSVLLLSIITFSQHGIKNYVVQGGIRQKNIGRAITKYT